MKRIRMVDRCSCVEPQIITDIVESCPLNKFAAAGLQQLYSADDKAVMWLKDIAMKAIVQ